MIYNQRNHAQLHKKYDILQFFYKLDEIEGWYTKGSVTESRILIL